MDSTVSAGWSQGREWPEPPWELPGIVAVSRVLSRTDEVVMSVGHIRVFSSGAEVTFEVRLGNGHEDDPNYTDDLYWLLTTRGRSPSPGRPTMSVRSADGSENARLRLPPSLELRAGGCTGPIWRFIYWMAPAPVEDTTFVGAWPARGVPAGETTIKGKHLRTARAAIQPL